MPHQVTAGSRRPVGHRRPVPYWIGVGLLLAGLAVLGWIAWQYWGTNWVADRKQHQLVQQWQQGQRLQPRYVPTGKVSALVRIPRFGKDYVVPVLEGTSEAVLAKGFGHFRHTSDPGEVGNYALAGHRVTHGEPLRNMPELRPGNRVIIETAHWRYVYRLDTNPNRLIVPFTALWVLDRIPDNPASGGVQPKQAKGQRLITLATCSELFHTDNRMIAFGHLVKKVHKTGA
ncbi:MAG: class E sortase [Marmoricola sp.]